MRRTGSAELGALLRDSREHTGLSQRQLAELTHCTSGMVSKVENGTRLPHETLAGAWDSVLETGGKLVGVARLAQRPQRREQPHTPVQLPPATTPFVGRSAELARLDTAHAHSTSTPILVLEGPAGVGKTALAVSWAHHHAAAFPDGVLTAELAGHRSGQRPAQAHDVLGGMLADLGVSDLPEDTAGRARLLRSVLSGRRILIILDDADSTEQITPLLPGTATCTVLLTSRRRLPGLSIAGSARLIKVTDLDTHSATALLSTLLEHTHAAALDQQALDDIAKSCAGLPLALRTAATLINDHPGIDLATIAEHLRGPRRLQILDTAALQDPHASLRSAFRASYRRLPPLAATLLRLLGQQERTIVNSYDAAAMLNVPLESGELALAHLLGEHFLSSSLTGCHMNILAAAYAAELDESAPADSGFPVAVIGAVSRCA